jgi:cytochrome bd ubiquinol oxidase subunit I
MFFLLSILDAMNVKKKTIFTNVIAINMKKEGEKIMLNVEILSRWQFAITIMFHFIFVPLSIGLILIICILEYLHMKKGDDSYRKLGDYFGNIFIVHYALGIVTGIGMSLQFGTNWSSYSVFMGDVFGAPLALEALIAFFLESTFTGIYIFKRSKVSPKYRFVVTAIIAFGTMMSSVWIITANGFMQNPVGYELAIDGSKVIMTDMLALVLNPYAIYMLVHTITAAYTLASMTVMSISAYKLLQKETTDEERTIFSKATKISAILLLIFSILMPIVGNIYMGYITPIQPAKIDAINGEIINVQPNPVPENLVPVVQTAFIAMVGIGTILILLALYTVIFYKRYMESRTLQKIFSYLWFLPFLAIYAGWTVTEVGRQPWTVYNLLLTSESVSQVPVGQVWFSIATIVLLNVVLLVTVVYLTIVQIKKSPNDMKYTYKN